MRPDLGRHVSDGRARDLDERFVRHRVPLERRLQIHKLLVQRAHGLALRRGQLNAVALELVVAVAVVAVAAAEVTVVWCGVVRCGVVWCGGGRWRRQGLQGWTRESYLGLQHERKPLLLVI